MTRGCGLLLGSPGSVTREASPGGSWHNCSHYRLGSDWAATVELRPPPASIRLQKSWSRLRKDDFDENQSVDKWWHYLFGIAPDALTHRQKTLVEAYQQAKIRKEESERHLHTWVIRHNKGEKWQATDILRRQRYDGAMICGKEARGGVGIPGDQILPFFLAARSATDPGKDLLGEALCSSYEAFRQTRRDNAAGKDDDPKGDEVTDLTHSSWFLAEFDGIIAGCSGAVHPKVHATVQKAVDLWEDGEMVLVFAFYRHTCRASSPIFWCAARSWAKASIYIDTAAT